MAFLLDGARRADEDDGGIRPARERDGLRELGLRMGDDLRRILFQQAAGGTAHDAADGVKHLDVCTGAVFDAL